MVVATSAWQEGGPVKQPVQAVEMPEQLLIVRYIQSQNQRLLNTATNLMRKHVLASVSLALYQV